MSKRVLVPFRNPNKLQPYLDAVMTAGAEPVAINVDDAGHIGDFNGLLLIGGTDVNPLRYGSAIQSETDQPDDARDQLELGLIDKAITRDLPIFGICRGLQILNVYYGGTLIQHLSSVRRHDVDPIDRGEPAHNVLLEQESILCKATEMEVLPVNSRHHQAIAHLGVGLYVTGMDIEDRTIEAVERRDRAFVLGVQWHPEDQVRQRPEQMKLFRRFTGAL